jgi:hypothetical protein
VIEAGAAPSDFPEILVPTIARRGDHSDAPPSRHPAHQIDETFDCGRIMSVVNQDLSSADAQQIEAARGEGR